MSFICASCNRIMQFTKADEFNYYIGKSGSLRGTRNGDTSLCAGREQKKCILEKEKIDASASVNIVDTEKVCLCHV